MYVQIHHCMHEATVSPSFEEIKKLVMLDAARSPQQQETPKRYQEEQQRLDFFHLLLGS